MKTEAEIRARLEELRGPEADREWPLATDLLEWALAPSPVVHEGAELARCLHEYKGRVNMERVFSEQWKSTNAPPHGINSGIGTLEWLVCMQPNPNQSGLFGGHRMYRYLTQEEATAAASAIQWLGTNCGWCWLQECIRACGFDILARRDAK